MQETKLYKIALAGSAGVGKTTFSKAITGYGIDELMKVSSTPSKTIANIFTNVYEGNIFHIYDPAGQLEKITKGDISAINTYCQLLSPLKDLILVGCVDAKNLETTINSLKDWIATFEKNKVKYNKFVVYVSKLYQQEKDKLVIVEKLEELGLEELGIGSVIIGDAYFERGDRFKSEVYFSSDNYENPHSYSEILSELPKI